MKKILIVDDLPENVFVLQDRLESKNYEVITAYNGEAGYQKAVSETPDLILLDLIMPDISGIEICRRLSQNRETALIPVIIVTAKSDEEGIQEGLDAGAYDFLSKPFNRIELNARVASALKFAKAQAKILEAEQKNTFAATVVTTNHKIKQPLTLMSLSSAAIKRELTKDEISKDAVIQRLSYIETAIKDITDVLNQLNAMKKPVFSEYVSNIKMVDVEEKSRQKDQIN